MDLFSEPPQSMQSSVGSVAPFTPFNSSEPSPFTPLSSVPPSISDHTQQQIHVVQPNDQQHALEPTSALAVTSTQSLSEPRSVQPPPSVMPIAPRSIQSVSTPSDITPQLQNIVATVNLCCQLDLRKIAQGARNAEYNPKRFAAVIMRIRDPRTTALVFGSGKVVITGAKSEDAAKLAGRKYARVIQKLGFPAKFAEFKIQNMVGSCDVKFPIRLEGILLMHGQFSSFEPELFPGLVYRMVKPRIVLLIFVSGKVVLTGAKNREDIYQSFNNIYPILKSFRKK